MFIDISWGRIQTYTQVLRIEYGVHTFSYSLHTLSPSSLSPPAPAGKLLTYKKRDIGKFVICSQGYKFIDGIPLSMNFYQMSKVDDAF